MYFHQAFITSVFVEQVKQDSSENDEFKDKPHDKSRHSRPRRTQNLYISKLRWILAATDISKSVLLENHTFSGLHTYVKMVPNI